MNRGKRMYVLSLHISKRSSSCSYYTQFRYDGQKGKTLEVVRHNRNELKEIKREIN